MFRILEAQPSPDYVPASPDYVQKSDPEEEPEEGPSEYFSSSDNTSEIAGLEVQAAPAPPAPHQIIPAPPALPH
nr:hypothetical protein [Tanacetum cinerariifolium]